MKNQNQDKIGEELDFLRYFYQNIDFGPAHSDIVDNMKVQYLFEKQNKLPDGYNFASDGETDLNEREMI